MINAYAYLFCDTNFPFIKYLTKSFFTTDYYYTFMHKKNYAQKISFLLFASIVFFSCNTSNTANTT